jgi:GntR family transcriptional regulator
MLIVVYPHSGVPVYRQLMDQVKFQIASGVLGPGEELPSTRALSAELGVNPMTISKAYSYLERDGVVEHRPGRPLVVSAVREDELDARRIEQLRQSLAAAVRITRQLDIEPGEAVRLFEAMLSEAGDEGAGGDTEDSE